MTDVPTASNSRLDRLGVLLSGLCAVHCVAGLGLVGLLGVGGGVLLNPAIHRIGLALAICVGAATIGMAALRHGHKLPLAIGSVGLALMATAVITGHGSAEALLTITGVACVATAHVINIRRGAC
ncbi:MerC domain-containing protein [Novosphingobium lentum]|uniref:MerC domain-containing protein n=1 Tax=Novosphingobium lentum TaxID=145287 RepID=UPI0008339790|nr:MerC domain-containing protein [Novosphingobium lentum]